SAREHAGIDGVGPRALPHGDLLVRYRGEILPAGETLMRVVLAVGRRHLAVERDGTVAGGNERAAQGGGVGDGGAIVSLRARPAKAAVAAVPVGIGAIVLDLDGEVLAAAFRAGRGVFAVACVRDIRNAGVAQELVGGGASHGRPPKTRPIV